jgi:hypothetical protein
MEQFLSRHQESIVGVLSGFDRMIFRGTLRAISYVNGMDIFLSVNKILLKDFSSFVQKQSARLKRHAEDYAARHGRPYLYVASASASKEQIAKGIMQRDGITKGLICVLACVEPCHAYAIRKDKTAKKLELISTRRQCLHFYFYLVDREFGFMHVRLQSWFPCSMQVYINGREWLARQMDKAGITYERRENAFVQIADFAEAQELADAAITRNWHKLLDRFGQRFNPLLQELNLRDYYWTLWQGEYATDVVFKDPGHLQLLYPMLIRHAIEQFSCEDVLRFLGRRTNICFNGEVKSEIRKRPEGTRIKHWVEENSIKMYDKQGCVLRIETTINNPRRFKVYREAHRHGPKTKAWIPMRKSVADIYRHVQVSRQANTKYLEALSVIGDQQPSHQLLDSVARPVFQNHHRYRALRPIAPEETLLFQSVLRGEFLLQGFRSADLRKQHFQPPSTLEEKRRQMGRTSRLIGMLRAHGLVKKVPKTRRYRITQKGHLVMSTSLYIRKSEIAFLQQASSI